MAESLGEHIKAIRTNLGWSEAQLARKAGVSQSVINDIEAGRNNNPRIKTLWKLGHAMGVPLSDLLNIKSFHSLKQIAVRTGSG